MRIKIIYSWWLLMLGLLSACGVANPGSPTIPPIVVTKTPSSTATIPPDNTAFGETICPEIVAGLPGDNITSGKLVLLDHDKKSLIFFDLENGDRESVSLTQHDHTHSYAISTNGKWLAYHHQGFSFEEHLVVVTTQGKQVVSLPWDKEWSKIAYWLDNERLVIKLWSIENPELLILNPFTNEQQKLSYRYRKLYSLEAPPDWRGAGPIIYAPSLQQAVFAGINDVYFLAQAESEEILASIPSISFLQYPTNAPQWSPDGSQVLIAAPIDPISLMDYKNYEMFSIDRNGAITKLTNFDNISSRIGITRYGWSPDGGNIAFLLTEFPNPDSKYTGEKLALLNPSTHQLSVYCIQGEMTTEYRKNVNGFYDDQIYTGVIWSPNSEQIIVENRIAEQSSNIILLDITKNIAFQIITQENVQPIGWMIDEP